MSTVKSKKLQVGTDASASNNFTIYQPATPDGTLRIGVGNADNPTEVGQFNANGYKAASPIMFAAKKTSNQSISSLTWTKVVFEAESFDYGGGFDLSNDKFVVPVTGIYVLNYHIRVNAGTDNYFSFSINGTRGYYWQERRSTSDTITGTTSQLISLTQNDYVEVYAYTANAGTITATENFFSGHLLHQT